MKLCVQLFLKRRLAQGEAAHNPSDHFEARRRWRCKTLVHRTTRTRRVTGGFLVSPASRFSIGCRLPASGNPTCR